MGFDWCIERVKESPYSELASELEITKALTFLRQRDIPRVGGVGYGLRGLLGIVSNLLGYCFQRFHRDECNKQMDTFYDVYVTLQADISCYRLL